MEKSYAVHAKEEMEKNLGKTSGLPVWVAALTVISAMQIVSAFSVRALVVIGPELTAAVGVAPQDVGILAGAASVGTMCFLLSGSASISYWGPVRILQIGALTIAAGALAGITASWWLLVVGAFFIGLGFGPSPPAGSEVLSRASPPAHMALIMSIKQSGVTVGGVLAGLLLPAVTIWANWQTAMLVTAILAVISAALAQPWRTRFDASRDTSRSSTECNLLSCANLVAPFVVLKKIPGMLALIVAVFCFASGQACIFAFFITQLTTELGFSLAIAGAAFAAMQVSGTFSRIIMGGIADKFGSARTLLLLAVASAAMMVVLSRIGPGCPSWLVMSIGAVIGLTSISWNGVCLAEVARIAPPGQVANATSGSTFFAFVAFALAPFLFTLGISMSGDYGLCFAAAAGVQLLAVPALWRVIRIRQSQ